MTRPPRDRETARTKQVPASTEFLREALVEEMLLRVHSSPRAAFLRERDRVVIGVRDFLREDWDLVAVELAREGEFANRWDRPFDVAEVVVRIARPVAERLGLPATPLPLYPVHAPRK